MWPFKAKTGHEAVKGAVARSSKWPAFRKRWLAEHPACEACGRTKNVVPHHRLPVHLFPQLELAPDNLISLCESGPGSTNCHCLIGHCGIWTAYNSTCDDDAKRMKTMLDQRIEG